MEPIVQQMLVEAAPFVDGMRDAAKACAEAQAAFDLTATAVLDLNDSMRGTDASAAEFAGSLIAAGTVAENTRDDIASVSAATGGLSRSFLGLMGRTVELRQVLGLLDDELHDKIADMGGVAAAASVLSGSMTTTAARTAAAGTAFRLWGTGMRLTGTALHWIIAGTAEFLSVAIPATVAAGAWAAVWAQGATNVAEHMKAVYTATEATANMFHVTAGQAVGLGDALQSAQNKANPDVYAALGAAVKIVKETMGGLAGVGLQVGKIFDTFAAKLVYDFSAAGGGAKMLRGLLSDMIPDLVEFGQIFGNIGHALASFASQMPGLAHVLLMALDGFTRLVVGVLDFTAAIHIGSWSILTAAMAMEEFARWGGLLVGLMGRLGFATTALEGNFSSVGGFLTRFGSVALNIVRPALMVLPAMISTVGSYMTLLGGRVGAAGQAMRDFGADMTDAVAGLSAFGAVAILAAAVGLGFLIAKMLTATTGAQKFAATLQATADKASNLNVINVLAENYGALAGQAATAAASLNQVAVAQGNVSGSATRFGTQAVGAYDAARESLATYTAAEKSAAQQMVVTAQHASDLARDYGTTLVGALALADQAGVHLNKTLTAQSWALGQIKIADLVQGYKSMGQSAGAVGLDMTMIAIQSGLASSQVSQLNQAADEFMQNVTGGTSGLAQFNQSLANMGDVIGHTSNNLGEFTGKFSIAQDQFSASLSSFTGKGAQAWINLDQVISSTAPQMIDWLRTAGEEGAISGPQFAQGVKDMIGELIPLAGANKLAQAGLLALAHDGGLNVTTFGQLTKMVKDSGASSSGFAKIVADATVKMGDMAAVAQQLGTVMQSDIIDTMDSARLSVSHLSADTNTWLNDLRNNAPYATTHTAMERVIKDMEFLGLSAKQAAALVKLMQAQIDATHGKTIYITAELAGNAAKYIDSGGGGTTGDGRYPNPHPGRKTPGVIPGVEHHGSNSPQVHVYVHGSVVSGQEVARAVQSGLNRKTFRNGSTQAFLHGRQH